MPQLRNDTKCVILALRQENLSVREIAKRINFSYVTVHKFLKKYERSGSIDRKQGTGKRNKKTSEREDRVLKKLSLKNRKATSKELSSTLNENFNIEISDRTVRRRLQGLGLHGRRPRKKPGLTQKMKSARLAFAKLHRDWTENEWKRVIFTDESKCNLNQSDGIAYVRRRVGEDLHEDCIAVRNKFPLSFMVWGCISYYGCGDLAFITGSMNADSYISIITNYLEPSIERLFPVSVQPIFQDDSAPCHRAKRVGDTISDKSFQSFFKYKTQCMRN